MTEDEAQAWLDERGWWHGRIGDRLRRIAQMVTLENERQNLIGRSTVASIFARHIVDSAQLIEHIPDKHEYWIDVGSGAGFPGLVIASITETRCLLVEPRSLRATFLQDALTDLQLSNAEVRRSSVGAVSSQSPVDIISARAYADLSTTFRSTMHLASPQTTWLLHKGDSAPSELSDAKKQWAGMFHVKQSFTHPGSCVIIASDVAPRPTAKRKK